MPQNQLLNAILQTEMNYGITQKSFSPIYSYFNLVTDKETAGIRSLYMDYNRKSALLWSSFLRLDGVVSAYTAKPDKIQLSTANGGALTAAYYEMNAFLVGAKTDKTIRCFETPGAELAQTWVLSKKSNECILQGYALNRDDRDPDKQVGFMAGIRVLCGKLHVVKGKITVDPDENGNVLLAFAFQVENVSADGIHKMLKNAPNSVDGAIESTRKWMAECIGNLDVGGATEKEQAVLQLAVNALIFNLAKMPGNLDGYVSVFPSRGSYTTHFTWDSCFQNLAYEKMNMQIAKDSMLQLIANMRSDGKIPQFLCCTWNRPHEVQPALIAWASKRIYDQTGDKAFMKKIFLALEKNNEWWLTQRMTRFGVIYCPHGLETGQDDSPRFDDGAVLAVDMNAYLLSQLNICAEIAAAFGWKSKAAKWKKAAAQLGQNMIKMLYDEEKNMFFDAMADTGVKRPLVTPSGLIPLWGGVPLAEDKKKAMVRDWLLNPALMFGNVPFPSVAYNESVYRPEAWWRGPMWPSEAWLMLEVLEQNGFTKELKIAKDKIYNMIVESGQLYELWNSQTGEGEGNPEQGWTAAIFIRLFSEKYQ